MGDLVDQAGRGIWLAQPKERLATEAGPLPVGADGRHVGERLPGGLVGADDRQRGLDDASPIVANVSNRIVLEDAKRRRFLARSEADRHHTSAHVSLGLNVVAGPKEKHAGSRRGGSA